MPFHVDSTASQAYSSKFVVDSRRLLELDSVGDLLLIFALCGAVWGITDLVGYVYSVEG